jgi:hypothetical protein
MIKQLRQIEQPLLVASARPRESVLSSVWRPSRTSVHGTMMGNEFEHLVSVKELVKEGKADGFGLFFQEFGRRPRCCGNSCEALIDQLLASEPEAIHSGHDEIKEDHAGLQPTAKASKSLLAVLGSHDRLSLSLK